MKLVAELLLVLSVCGLVNSYPTHASCKIVWTFSEDCPTVFNKLIEQIKVWNMSAPCNNSEKCLYQIKSSTANSEIKATHSTPVKHYVDDLTFSFNSTSSTACIIQAFSTSETWYAVLDYGTNYCNLHNLVDGAGLSPKEVTSDSSCTQYSSHDCSKY